MDDFCRDYICDDFLAFLHKHLICWVHPIYITHTYIIYGIYDFNRKCPYFSFIFLSFSLMFPSLFLSFFLSFHSCLYFFSSILSPFPPSFYHSSKHLWEMQTSPQGTWYIATTTKLVWTSISYHTMVGIIVWPFEFRTNRPPYESTFVLWNCIATYINIDSNSAPIHNC